MRGVALGLLLASALPQAAAACEVEDPATQATASRIPVPETALLVGSSSFEWGLGPALAEHLEELGVRTVVNSARQSTGLARPDFHDWLTEAERLADLHHPGLVLVQLGGNDAQHLRSPTGRRVADWGSADWTETYANRVRTLLHGLSRRGAQVVVVGLSHPEDPAYARRVAAVNAVWSVVSAEQHAWFLSTWDLTTAPHGGPAPTVEIDGQSRRLRRDDGIHLGKVGSLWVADALAAQLAPRLDRRAACGVDSQASLPLPSRGGP